MTKPGQHDRRIWIPIGLFVWGLIINLVYAGRGFMPLDQSIIFDGGWRLLSGQVPFRDFSTLTGLCPMFFQAGFFAVFGVSWFAYCLHASVFNGLYCVLAYGLLRKLGGSRTLSAAYAAASGLSFYPVSGTPYMEHHAFFFVILAIWLLVSSRDASLATTRLYLLVTPLVLVLSFLSKQHVPVLFGGAVLVAAIYGYQGKDYRATARWLILGAGAAALAVLLGSVLSGLVPTSVWQDFVQQTAETGARRLSAFGSQVYRFVSRSDLRPTLPKTQLALLFLSGLILIVSRRRWAGGAARLERWALSAGLVAGSIVFSLVTWNQMEGAHANMFISLGILHVLVLEAGPLHTLQGNLARRACLVLFVLLGSLHSYHFYRAASLRTYQDVGFSAKRVVSLQTEELEFLQFQLPWAMHPKYEGESLDAVVSFLKTRPRNFFLLGDASILYGVTGRPSVNPYVYFHSQMRRRAFSRSRRAEYEERLLDNIREYDVGYVVLEGPQTWTGVRLDRLPQLSALVEARARHETSFGPFRVIELEPLD